MTRIEASVLLFGVAASLMSGCGGRGGGGKNNDQNGTLDADQAISDGDGVTVERTQFSIISVDQPDGSSDDVWLYAATPAGDGPFPVVIYAHGQSPLGVVNCDPNDENYWTDPQEKAELFASMGYLGVSVFFRHSGSGAPSGTQVKMRDHYFYDARTMLAAARWARDEHGQGSGEIAMIGGSMGAWPAFWAVTEHEQLEDLQQGLNFRTLILVGESANHLSNQALKFSGKDLEDPTVHAEYVTNLAYTAMLFRASAMGLSVVDMSDLDSGSALGDGLAVDLTPDGVELIKAVFFGSSDSQISGCLGVLPTACSTACLDNTVSALFDLAERQDISLWAGDDIVEAVSYWSPPQQQDPGADNENDLLRMARMLSPAFSADSALVERGLLALSENDKQHYDSESAQLLIDKWDSIGIRQSDHPVIIGDSQGKCGHADYLDPDRACGLEAIEAELAAAFQ